jgi:hypothetical protein
VIGGAWQSDEGSGDQDRFQNGVMEAECTGLRRPRT